MRLDAAVVVVVARPSSGPVANIVGSVAVSSKRSVAVVALVGLAFGAIVLGCKRRCPVAFVRSVAVLLALVRSLVAAHDHVDWKSPFRLLKKTAVCCCWERFSTGNS